MTISSDNKLVFTPAAGFAGQAEFTYYWDELGPEIDPTTGQTITVNRESEGLRVYSPATVTVGVAAPVNYVAMGDSYSSGESVQPYQDTDGCHRSSLAYPNLLTNANGWNLLDFAACSGATSENVISTGQRGEHSQLSQFNALKQGGSNPNLITLTVGGDDIGFASIIKYCIGERDFGLGSLLNWNGSGGSCANDSSFAPDVFSTVQNEYAPLVELYRQLAAAAGPDTSILAADYPQIFPPNSDQQTCGQLRPYFTKDDQSWFRLLTATLDANIITAARNAGINGVNVVDAFSGHAICDSNGSWLNAVTNVNGWDDPSGSFHPTAAGQQGYAQAYTDFINNAVASGAPLTSAGLPADPADPPGDASTTPLQLRLAPLTVTPPVVQSGCTDAYQGGEQVTITGGGYAPGGTVTVHLLDANSSGAANHQILTTVTADSTGQISASVRLPYVLAGVDASGTGESLAYVETLGSGATSAQQLDNEIINVAPHGGACGIVTPYPFSGFDHPVDNLPVVNMAHAGQAIPLKFGLGGDRGLDILTTGSPNPTVQPYNCTTGAPTNDITAATAPGNSGLQYDPGTGEYTWVWKTDKTLTGCQRLTLALDDGTIHQANFQFK